MILRYRQHHPSMGRGSIEDRGDGVLRLYMNPGMDQVTRRCVLGHEVTHGERGVLPIDAPPALRQKEEETVDRIVAKRMVPLDELRAFAAARGEFGPVTVAEVCEEFDVTPDVALKAMWLAA
jgi:hypothetical protein